MKFTRSALLLLATLLLAAACKQPPSPPRPADTGSPGGGRDSISAEYVPGSIISRPRDDDAPPPRDRSFDSNGENARLEGILPSIYFDFDQSAVRPTDRPALQEAADYLIRHAGAKLLIEGHCDWRGTAEYNLALGERRAASARDYLLSLGIADDRLEIVSMGDLEAAEVSDEVQLQQDRRADLIVIP